MTGTNKKRRPDWGVVTISVMAIFAGVSCGDDSKDAKAEAAQCFGKSTSEVQLVSHGGDFGGWQLFAAHDWQGRSYAVALQAPWSQSDCGNLGDGILRSSGGGSNYHGKSVNFVYGIASDPVRKVRVSYASGAVQEIEPMSATGFDFRFFVDVREASGGATLVGLDSSGNPVPGATS